MRVVQFFFELVPSRVLFSKLQTAQTISGDGMLLNRGNVAWGLALSNGLTE